MDAHRCFDWHVYTCAPRGRGPYPSRVDRRTLAGKRDYALLRVLGDCGPRSAELRGLRARGLRRPRSNARHYRLFVRGKGGREREVPVPQAVQQALEAWLKVHPLARGVGLLDRATTVVPRLGRHGHEQPSLSPSPPSVFTGSCVAAARPPACPPPSRGPDIARCVPDMVDSGWSR